MKHDEFVAQVRHRAHLRSPEEATKAIRATLLTLGERLLPDQAQKLARELPPEIAQYLEEPANGQDFGVDEFYTRVGDREGVDISEATIHARWVLELLKRAVSPGVMGRVHDRLGREYDSLFQGISKGHVPGGKR